MFLALLGLIPYIGNLLVMIPAMIIALVHFSATSWGTVQGAEKAVIGETASVLVEGATHADTYFVTQVSPDGTRAEVLLYAWTAIPLPSVWAYPVSSSPSFSSSSRSMVSSPLPGSSGIRWGSIPSR